VLGEEAVGERERTDGREVLEYNSRTLERSFQIVGLHMVVDG